MQCQVAEKMRSTRENIEYLIDKDPEWYTQPNWLRGLLRFINDAVVNFSTDVEVTGEVVGAKQETRTTLLSLIENNKLAPNSLYRITNASSGTRVVSVQANGNNSFFPYAFDVSTGQSGTYNITTDTFTPTGGAVSWGNIFGTLSSQTDLTNALNGKQAAGDYATLVSGKVPANQLPSYVDDVEEYASYFLFPNPGEAGKIYVALNDGSCYRWSGSAYILLIIGATEVQDQLNSKASTEEAIAYAYIFG
jgi:hypothetical protein